MMKKTINISISVLLAAASISWTPIKESETPTPISLSQNEQEDKLVLNKGKRWKANEETTTGVNNMIEIVGTFKADDEVKSYNKLAENLRAEMSVIFDKCSMKGESHNNLHTFLVPIFGYLKQLESDDLKSCESGFKALKPHLNEYAKFFE